MDRGNLILFAFTFTFLARSHSKRKKKFLIALILLGLSFVSQETQNSPCKSELLLLFWLLEPTEYLSHWYSVVGMCVSEYARVRVTITKLKTNDAHEMQRWIALECVEFNQFTISVAAIFTSTRKSVCVLHFNQPYCKYKYIFKSHVNRANRLTLVYHSRG